MRYISRLCLIVISTLVLLTGCGQNSKDPNTIKVGTIAGPESSLIDVAKQVAKEKYGLTIKIVEFTDYTMPNTALNDGSIDANMYQHLPYLQSAVKARGYKLTPIGKTFVFPMGLYSRKIKSLQDLQSGATVAIPNDPSNEARALLLLQKAKLITLRGKNNVNATPIDIVSNPKKLKFEELDAADLPRVLQDVSIAAINTNYAIPAGLIPTKDAIYLEDKNSPYANLVVVRTQEKDNKNLRELVITLHSPEVLAAAKKIFKGQAIVAWSKSQSDQLQK